MSTAPRGEMALEGEVTIYRAAELKEALLQALACHPGGLTIDLAGVTEIDCAGTQLLIAAKRAALAAGVPLALTAHSAKVTDVFELLDLAALFGDSLIVPA